MDRPRTPRSRRLPVRVAVTSDQALVSEAVVAALRSGEFDPVLLRWPQAGPRLIAGLPPRPRTRDRAAGTAPAVGLLMSELSRVELVLAAQTVMAGLPIPWLVMAGADRGPAWGALYESGATLVVRSDTGLAEVADLLVEVSTLRSAAPRRDRKQLIRAWQTFVEQRSGLTARLRTLTEREGEVLHQLHQGYAVRAIAEQSEVAVATVRSQVKAILKKLEVNSQVAAVALYEDFLNDSTQVEIGSLEARPRAAPGRVPDFGDLARIADNGG